nr:RecName: Full=Alpha-conotoxin OIB; AltName: Full=Alpha-conotoxin SI-like [Conus obscurus]
ICCNPACGPKYSC